MKEIKFIELVLENCEAIKIQREHIGTFYVEDIKRSISRSAMNSISDHISCKELFLQISSKANVEKSYSSTWSNNKILPFERLKRYSDITAININYKDDTQEYIFVKWGGDSDNTNEYQSNTINELTGDFYLVVSEKEKADTYFKEHLEDKDGWYWDLYSESEED